MKKVQERTVRKTLTMATSRIPWQPLIGLIAVIVVMSVVVLSGQELKHVPPAAPSFVVLHTFAGSPTDGAFPIADLIQDAADNLYGTTFGGGERCSTCFNGSCGVVFKLSATGTETVLHAFTDGAGGTNPNAGLTRDTAGNLYGTARQGGAQSKACSGGGCGTVFKLGPTGAEIVLHSFTGEDGANPFGDLIQDAAGNLYGTASGGGATSTCEPPYGCGVVFKLSPSGAYTILHSFTGADGAYPEAGLVRDAAANLYGTTARGGAYNSIATRLMGAAWCSS
jgi:uncharacterized repeat protein (TIGR03803 family)